MTLRKFEVWYNDDNLRLLQRLDKVRSLALTFTCIIVSHRCVRSMACAMGYLFSIQNRNATGFAVRLLSRQAPTASWGTDANSRMYTGATTYHNFKAWAVGKPHERFLAPPTEDETMNKFKSTFDNIKNNGFDFSFLKTLQDRLEDGRRRAGSAPDAAKEGTGGNSAFAFYGGVLTPKARPGVCSKRPKRG